MMSRAGRFFAQAGHCVATVVAVPIVWVILQFVKLGDWLEKKQLERALRKHP